MKYIHKKIIQTEINILILCEKNNFGALIKAVGYTGDRKTNERHLVSI